MFDVTIASGKMKHQGCSYLLAQYVELNDEGEWGYRTARVDYEGKAAMFRGTAVANGESICLLELPGLQGYRLSEVKGIL